MTSAQPAAGGRTYTEAQLLDAVQRAYDAGVLQERWRIAVGYVEIDDNWRRHARARVDPEQWVRDRLTVMEGYVARLAALTGKPDGHVGNNYAGGPVDWVTGTPLATRSSTHLEPLRAAA